MLFTLTNPWQDVLLLERIFSLEKCPGRELCQELATRLKVRPRQVQVWFQNRRQRTKGSKGKDSNDGNEEHAQVTDLACDATSRNESERRADLLIKVSIVGLPCSTSSHEGVTHDNVLVAETALQMFDSRVSSCHCSSSMAITQTLVLWRTMHLLTRTIRFNLLLLRLRIWSSMPQNQRLW